MRQCKYWAVIDWDGFTPLSAIAYKRTNAIAGFLEMLGEPHALSGRVFSRQSLTRDARNAWGRYKRNGWKCVKVEIQQIDSDRLKS